MNKDEITADWARKTSKEILGQKVQSQINQCLVAIEHAVSINRNECNVDIWVETLTKQDLEKRGFKVIQHSDQRNGDFLQISW